MTLAKRVIPCLDVSGGRVVKGVNFLNLKDAGDPVELAKKYDTEGADELTFLDISASIEERKTTLDIVSATAEQVFIPLTVGGGIRTVNDVDNLLRAGADKVSVNTAAINRPELINEISDRFGNQVLVLSVDARRAKTKSGYEVTTHGGRESSGLDAISWIQEGIKRGIGEILLNSMDADGTKAGFDLEMIKAIREISGVPVIASGGAGKISDFGDALAVGADAVLAASVFHFGEIKISQVKSDLSSRGFSVRGQLEIGENQIMSAIPVQIQERLDKGELIAAIAQDAINSEVLMLAWMNLESLNLTIKTSKATYWSRSRNSLWIKGETSGHYQEVLSISYDCDGDAILLKVNQIGAACHTGERSCFHRGIETN